MEKFNDKLLAALFCLFNVNAGNSIIASRITNPKRPGKKMRRKESTSMRNLKVT